MTTWYVYALCEPSTGAVRYVGKSSNPARRLQLHISAAASRPIRAWVSTLGATPKLELLAEAETETESLILEQNWIAKLRASGAKLLNGSAGGERSASRKAKFTGFEERILSRRAELGMTQKALAQAAGVWQPTLSHLENGHRPHMSADFAVLLARALDVSVEWLVTGEERSSRASAAE